MERVVITGRVIDRFANPIPGLTASDFRLRVDGVETPLESAEWIPSRAEESSAATAEADARRPANLPAPDSPSRLTVMLFQWEIAGQKDEGFVRMMRQAMKMARTAEPEDRIAVFAFGSSLRLLQDWTLEHETVAEAIRTVRAPSRREAAFPPGGPALAPFVERCGQVDSIEGAFVCIGNALQQYPGPKTLLFFGWTIRTYRTTEHARYPVMVEAITKADTSVFALDVSDGRHTLEKGIRLLAADTGGLYEGDNQWFPDRSRLRVQHALQGSYELVFRDPATERGWHQVEVELTRVTGRTLFRRWYRD